MKRVLVDGGSIVDVLFYDTFQKIGLTNDHLSPEQDPLVSFDATQSFPRGSIVLPITTVEKLVYLNFIVLKQVRFTMLF